MYDFGGGMENVTATILGEGALTEARDGFRRMASLNAHELAHQWFGDLVTCSNWGDVWLNESFATFMESLYMEHSRGPDAYAWEVDGNSRSYFQEARRYRRPLSTRLYPNPDSLFDSHAYPKGAAVLHTLRRYMGDDAFLAGLRHYLNKHRHSPVESANLRQAMAEATGINVEAFWAQWIEKPGHPVLDYTWTWKPDGPEMGPGKILLTVKQIQDTSDGTPIYDIQTEIGYVRNGLGPEGFITAPIRITKAEETFEIPSESQVLTVVLDPNHDFLREIPELHWTAGELPLIFTAAKSAPIRQEALTRLLAAGPPNEATLKMITDQVAADKDREQPAFRNLQQLAALEKPELRSFWLGQLSHANSERQATAVSALAKLPAEPGTIQRLRFLVSDSSPLQVVVNAINALAAWDAAANKDVFEKAKEIKDRRGRIARAAEAALEKIKG
jgi:aminopeptidase N